MNKAAGQTYLHAILQPQEWETCVIPYWESIQKMLSENWEPYARDHNRIYFKRPKVEE